MHAYTHPSITSNATRRICCLVGQERDYLGHDLSKRTGVQPAKLLAHGRANVTVGVSQSGDHR